MYIQILTSLSEELLRFLIGTVTDVLYQLIRDEPLYGLHDISKTGDMILHPCFFSRKNKLGSRRRTRIPRLFNRGDQVEVTVVVYY